MITKQEVKELGKIDISDIEDKVMKELAFEYGLSVEAVKKMIEEE